MLIDISSPGSWETFYISNPPEFINKNPLGIFGIWGNLQESVGILLDLWITHMSKAAMSKEESNGAANKLGWWTRAHLPRQLPDLIYSGDIYTWKADGWQFAGVGLWWPILLVSVVLDVGTSNWFMMAHTLWWPSIYSKWKAYGTVPTYLFILTLY